MDKLSPAELSRLAAAPNGRPLRALELIAASATEFSEVSGDLTALLKTIARLGVESIGDLCIVQLLSEDGTVLTLGAAYHRNPHVVALVRETYAEPNPAHEGVAARVLAAPGPIFVRDVDEARYRRALSPRFRPLLDEIGVCSGIMLPLRADGQVLGTLLLARERGGERYTEDDVVVAQELGTRAAIAIRNAKNVAALRLSQAILRHLADSATAAVLVTWQDDTIEYANRFFLDYVGLTRDELNTQGWLSLFHPADRDRIVPARDVAFRGGDEFVDECRVRRHDGMYRWNLLRIVRMANDRGTRTRFVGIAIDIDDRRRAEEHQRLLMEASALATEQFDLDSTFARMVSLVVPAMADYAAAVTLDASAPRLRAVACADPKAEPLLREAIAAQLPHLSTEYGLGRSLATGESDLCPFFEQEWERFTRDPEQIARFERLSVSSYMTVALKWQERIFGALTFGNFCPYRRLTTEDLAFGTELAHKASAAMEHARLYEEAAAASRAKDDFLGLVSHELRTPITVILGGTEVLINRAEQLDDKTKASALGDIHMEAERLNRIVENLLTLARLETRAQELQPVKIAREIEHGVAQFRRTHPDRPVTFESHADAAIVSATDYAVEHALRNYLSNADKYSPEAAPIDVRAEQVGDEVVVTVLDRGPGLPNAEAGRVFEPFYRSEAVPAAAGVGIGLAVCQRVIEASHGRVWLETRPAGGMIAAFALPVMKPDASL